MNLKLGAPSFSASVLSVDEKQLPTVYSIYHYKSPHSHLCEANLILGIVQIVQSDNSVKRLKHHLSTFN